MKIIYRITDADNRKQRPDWFSKEKCLANCIKEFPLKDNNWTIIADSIGDTTKKFIENLVDSSVELIMLDVNSNSKAFNFLLDKVKEVKEEFVYIVEDDYIHYKNSQCAIRDAFSLNCDYCTLYDHPQNKVINKINKDWVQIRTTTATFAAKTDKFKNDMYIFKKLYSKYSNYDFYIFSRLVDSNGRILLAPVKGLSTHCLNGYLSKNINWEKYVK